MREDERPRLQVVADYQFGAGAGTALFPEEEGLSVSRTSSGRPRQVHADDDRLVTYASDGRYTLASPVADGWPRRSIRRATRSSSATATSPGSAGTSVTRASASRSPASPSRPPRS